MSLSNHSYFDVLPLRTFGFLLSFPWEQYLSFNNPQKYSLAVSNSFISKCFKIKFDLDELKRENS